ncbi:MAG: radical SAM protein [Chloroflexi bacterium]|nr:radical SAM protein [Chloroflexota bacterium]NOG74943.1 radical SAM protein [Chloroflexota bacterium]
MITEIDRAALASIRNPVFRAYASRYVEIYEDFLAQIGQFGVPLMEGDRQEVETCLERLREKGAHIRNDERSVYVNHISPACLACQTGVGSATLFISLQCHRHCFFCFNPNQENYEGFVSQKRDLGKELEEYKRREARLKHLALTGGEPLLHKEETLAFFREARRLFPGVYTRLYTSGDHADSTMLAALKEAGLQEIRFSIRVEDSTQARRHTLERIEEAKAHIPFVMVEMPVLPGRLEEMKDILRELERIGIFSVNLLEFCFPLFNADEYRQRGYHIKTPPYRVLNNYWYAGGLPVAQSEMDCLALVEFALDNDFKMGVHYCSLENKHTAQIYQQNHAAPAPAVAFASKKDYFLKTAKVFGGDVPRVKEILAKKRKIKYTYHPDYDCLEFHVRGIRALQRLDVEIGISTNILEQRGNEQIVRELKMELATPRLFDMEMDI